MKPRNFSRASLFISATLLFTHSAQAVDGTWTGGNIGTWDTSNTNWTVVGDPAWDITNGADNKAIFNTAGDLATLSGAVYTGGITFSQTGSVSDGSSSLNSINYATNGGSMAFNVAAGKLGTINANINYGGTGAAGNILNLSGGGALTLAKGATLVANDGAAKSSYFSVDGGSTLNVTGGILQTMILNSSNRGSSGSAYLGGSSGSNTLNVSDSGKLVTGNFNVGTSGNNGNEVYISAPGTNNTGTTPATDTASWVLYGNSAQLNLNSSDNLVEISNGAFVNQTSGGGTGTWTIGNAVAHTGNRVVVKGLGSTVSRGSSGVAVGGAGPTNHSFGGAGGGSDNAVIVKDGGLWVGGRVYAGYGNGVDVTDNNFFQITGTSDGTPSGVPSYYRLNGGNNGHFAVGRTANASGNSFRVEAGARSDIFGTGTGKDLGIGFVAGSNNNYVKVSGVGSVLNFITAQELTVGGNASVAGGSGNHVDVFDGGSLIMSNVDNVIPLAASVSWTTWAAPPTTSTAMVLAGAGSSLNLGNGTANTSLVKIGAVNGHTGVELANATSTLNFNNGRLVAGVTGNLVSGDGEVILVGDGYVSNASGTNTITVEISGAGDFIKEGAGQLDLTYANTYTGDTLVDEGTLRVTSAYLANAAAVRMFTGGVLFLDTLGATDTVGSLYLEGIGWMPDGTYNAGNSSGFITGSGSLLVGIPEPASVLLGGLGLLTLLRRRRDA